MLLNSSLTVTTSLALFSYHDYIAVVYYAGYLLVKVVQVYTVCGFTNQQYYM